jgi:hypothetical protein
VTHNPDLECYADRILYVEDGTFKKQALNSVQSRIDFDSCEWRLSACALSAAGSWFIDSLLSCACVHRYAVLESKREVIW